MRFARLVSLTVAIGWPIFGLACGSSETPRDPGALPDASAQGPDASTASDASAQGPDASTGDAHGESGAGAADAATNPSDSGLEAATTDAPVGVEAGGIRDAGPGAPAATCSLPTECRSHICNAGVCALFAAPNDYAVKRSPAALSVADGLMPYFATANRDSDTASIFLRSTSGNRALFLFSDFAVGRRPVGIATGASGLGPVSTRGPVSVLGPPESGRAVGDSHAGAASANATRTGMDSHELGWFIEQPPICRGSYTTRLV